ncbi:hypothetical protein H8K90_11640 [Winogradskyella echinorum]|uniref:Uncharacterized protein n=1 Tax=Winogradskyella echinorum TaxID=538189 RepID=A0ABR6Y2R5_9FLAO|nr:hypothetical protein [Winogradskyella echinorum]MBC3847036.1 hypothetical protein [Winogradskyella echinorum]MBC5751384.1 hypothetical protein [Winogradskyella echinorum]
MGNTIFHSPKFEFKGISIPEFDVESGKLIRLCVPNFDSKGNSLVQSFRNELMIHFEKKIPKIKLSKEYSESGFRKIIKSFTVENYITEKLNVDGTKAKIIAEYLELCSKKKVNNLTIGKNKALAIKCDFEKYDILIFDYYGVSVNEIDYLERIVDAEIAKNKCGITIDRLEFNQGDETNKNIERIKITVGNTVYN